MSTFRLLRRYFAPNGMPGAWHVVGDIPAHKRTTTMSGYLETDRFELILQAVGSAATYDSNKVYVRFPSKGGERPY